VIRLVFTRLSQTEVWEWMCPRFKWNPFTGASMSQNMQIELYSHRYFRRVIRPSILFRVMSVSHVWRLRLRLHLRFLINQKKYTTPF